MRFYAARSPRPADRAIHLDEQAGRGSEVAGRACEVHRHSPLPREKKRAREGSVAVEITAVGFLAPSVARGGLIDEWHLDLKQLRKNSSKQGTWVASQLASINKKADLSDIRLIDRRWINLALDASRGRGRLQVALCVNRASSA